MSDGHAVCVMPGDDARRIAVEESDETVGWFQKIVKSRYATELDVAPLYGEAKQLRAILAASYATARRNYRETH